MLLRNNPARHHALQDRSRAYADGVADGDLAAAESSAWDLGKSWLRRAQLQLPWVCSSQAMYIFAACFAGGVFFGKLLCRLSFLSQTLCAENELCLSNDDRRIWCAALAGPSETSTRRGTAGRPSVLLQEGGRPSLAALLPVGMPG